jgi:hypothetical protein
VYTATITYTATDATLRTVTTTYTATAAATYIATDVYTAATTVAAVGSETVTIQLTDTLTVTSTATVKSELNDESCMRTYSVNIPALVALIASAALILFLLVADVFKRLERVVEGWAT